MITVTSTFAGTVRSLADANGPYVVDAGSTLTLTGGPNNAATTFAWDFADGTYGSGRVVQHVYPRTGVYPVKLTTTVSQPGGVVTEEYAQVRVRNTPPVVSAPPALSVDEGTPLDVTIQFTDHGWLDTHRALFTWGDDTPPAWGTVTEAHDPSLGEGRTVATHAWCDSGSYVVSVEVFDDNGGVGTAMIAVEVRNVAPIVDAGPDRFAYPCVPITLIAGFRDPGWCDTHTATWDFGECDPPQPAVVREEHHPPAGLGVVIATHTYEHCGTYAVTCRVIDDDGGVGEDTKLVRVVHLHNGGFEDGFHRGESGEVGNRWSIADSDDHDAATGARFSGEQVIVHGGQRSQRISGGSRFDGGLIQRVGANPGWEYQVTAWYHIATGAAARCRLGVDPAGGVSSSASLIAWSETGAMEGDWVQLCARTTATADAVSIHLTAAGEPGAEVWFDDVVLAPYPCCDDDAPKPDPPPEREKRCVDWVAEKEPHRLPPTFDRDGFGFASNDGTDLQIATFGPPQGTGKLLIPLGGLVVVLPFPASEVTAEVVTSFGMEVAAVAGTVVVDRQSVPGSPIPQSVSLRGTGISVVKFQGKGEDLLLRLCAARDVDSKPTDNTDDKTKDKSQEEQWQTTPSVSKLGRKTRLPRR